MIVMICGLIGAGKTTFAKANFDHVTDYNEVKSKARQIVDTLGRHRRGQTVAHVTCWPTPLEKRAILERMDAKDVRMVWVNTGPLQSMENVLKRNRRGDRAHLRGIVEINKAPNRRRLRSSYPWKDVDMFT